MIGVGRRKLGFARTKSPYKNMAANPDYVLIGFCGPVLFVAGASITLLTPFYSKEAADRGANLNIQALVYGIYQLVMLSAAPLIGKLMVRSGPCSVLNWSLVLFTLGLTAFGLLERISTSSPFLLLSFVFRVVQAVACTGVFTSSYVLISFQCANYPATNFGILQAFVALGLTLGPVFGDLLYNHRGFHEPFFVLGGIFLVARFISSVPLSYSTTTSSDNLTDSSKVDNFFALFKISSMLVSSLGMIATAISLGFMCTSLSEHLLQFNLNTASVSVVLALNSFVYSVTAPMWGYLCDNFGNHFAIQSASQLLIFSAFLIVGRTPFLPFPSAIWLVIVGLVFQGLAFGGSFISTFSIALTDSRKCGFQNHMSTFALVATLWQAILSFGVWMGASISGAIQDSITFSNSSWLFLISSLLMACATGLYIFSGFSQRSKDALKRYQTEVASLARTKEHFASYGVGSSMRKPDFPVVKCSNNFVA